MANERQKRYHKRMERIEFYVHPDLKESYLQGCKSLGLSYRQVFEKGFEALGVKIAPIKKKDPNQVDIFEPTQTPVAVVEPPKPEKKSTKKIPVGVADPVPKPVKESTKKILVGVADPVPKPVKKSTKKVITPKPAQPKQAGH